MPILDPSLQYYLLTNFDSSNKTNKDFFIRYLRIASANLNLNLDTIQASIQFKEDLKKCSSIMSKVYSGRYYFENDLSNPTINNYYQYLLDKINPKYTNDIPKKQKGFYYIYKDIYQIKLFQPMIEFPSCHAWYFTDSPIAILCVNCNDIQNDDIFSYINLEIDLMAASGFTIVLCFTGSLSRTNTISFIRITISTHKFAEIHFNENHDFDDSSQDFTRLLISVENNLSNNGYLYLYTQYCNKDNETHFTRYKNEKPFFKLIFFSDKLKYALRQGTMSSSFRFCHKSSGMLYTYKPFIYCKTGFDQDLIRILLCNVPMYNTQDEEADLIPFDSTGISFAYVSKEDFLYSENFRVPILYYDIKNKSSLIEKYVDFDDIHLIRPDFYVNDSLYLTRTDKKTLEAVKIIQDAANQKYNENQGEELKKESIFHFLKSQQIRKGLQYVTYAYQHYATFLNSKKNFFVHTNQIFTAFEACKICLLNSSKYSKGVVYQVETGEGKSCIIQLIAAVLALSKKTVHITSSNINLANRDYYESKKFFTQLNLESAVLLHYNELPYVNFQNLPNDNNVYKKDEFHYPRKFFRRSRFKNSSNMNFPVCGLGNNNVQTNKYKANVIFSTFINFECLYLRMMELSPSSIHPYFSNCSLLIDEADSILIDELTNGTILSRPMNTIGNEILTFVYQCHQEKKDPKDVYNIVKEKWPKCMDLSEKHIIEMYKEIDIVNQPEFTNGKKYSIEKFYVKEKQKNVGQKLLDFYEKIKKSLSFKKDSKNDASKEENPMISNESIDDLNNIESDEKIDEIKEDELNNSESDYSCYSSYSESDFSSDISDYSESEYSEADDDVSNEQENDDDDENKKKTRKKSDSKVKDDKNEKKKPIKEKTQNDDKIESQNNDKITEKEKKKAIKEKEAQKEMKKQENTKSSDNEKSKKHDVENKENVEEVKTESNEKSKRKNAKSSDKENKREYKMIVPFDYDHKGILEPNKEFSGFIQQFIAIKEIFANKENENLVVKDVSMNYLYVSHPIFVDLYSGVCGLTGTVGNKFDKEVLKDYYKLSTKKIPRNKPNRRIDHPTIICSTIKERNEKIVDEVVEYNRREIPVLVIFRDLNEISYVYHALALKGIKNINVFDGKDEKIKPDKIAGLKGAVSLGTNFCGRGTDIKDPSKPLHVVVTYYTSNTRVLHQAFGRTARQGNEGTVRVICLLSQFLAPHLTFDKDSMENVLSDFKIKNRLQNLFIEDFKKKRKWIFDSKIKPQRINREYIQIMREARININRIKVCNFKYPICMKIESFLKIQAQKIFSLFNCPNCKYTWMLFQRYIREMILESWSIFIDQIDNEYYSSPQQIGYEEFLNKELKHVKDQLNIYLPQSDPNNQINYEIVPTFMHIFNLIVDTYQDNILSSFPTKLVNCFKPFGTDKFCTFNIGFKPYSLVDSSGSRINTLNDEKKDQEFITDPELKYLQKEKGCKPKPISITQKIDDIFNKMCQKINEKIGGFIGLKFFLRRTLGGCEFGLCFDFDIKNENLSDDYNCLIDKDPLFVFTISVRSMAPLLAGVLIIGLVYIAKLAETVGQFMSGINIELIGKILKKTVRVVLEKLASNLIQDKINDFVNKICGFLLKIVLNQIELLQKNNNDAAFIFGLLLKIVTNKDFSQSGDTINKMFENNQFIKINSSFGESMIFDNLPMKHLLKIGLLIMLAFGSFMFNFYYKYQALKYKASKVAVKYDKTPDADEAINQNEKFVKKEEYDPNE